VKSENTQEDAPMAEDAPVAVKSSYGDRLQKLMAEGTPEMLEAEVRDMKHLLEAVRQPMASMASVQQDAKHWVTQIGKSNA
jgi:hypothetical protein